MNESQSAVDLDELERLAKAATPGPWAYLDAGDKGGSAFFVGPCYEVNADGEAGADLRGQVEMDRYDEDADEFVRVADHDEWVAWNDNSNSRIADAAFIAAANPQTVLALIVEVRALRGAA